MSASRNSLRCISCSKRHWRREQCNTDQVIEKTKDIDWTALGPLDTSRLELSKIQYLNGLLEHRRYSVLHFVALDIDRKWNVCLCIRPPIFDYQPANLSSIDSQSRLGQLHVPCKST